MVRKLMNSNHFAIRLIALFLIANQLGCSISGSIFGQGGSFATAPDGSPLIQKVIELDTISLNLTEGGAAVINVALDNLYATDTTISLSFSDPGGRFQAIPAQITIPSGQISSSVTLQTVENALYNGSQSFTLSISSPDADTQADPSFDELSINLNDNDSPPTVSFSVASQTVSEDVGTATVTVSLSTASAVTTTIPIQMAASSTATQGAGQDYTLSSTNLNILAGSTSANLTVTVNDDVTYETPSEVINFEFGTLVNATAGTQITHALTINDNEIFNVAVVPTYPNNADWLDYVKNNNGGTNDFDQPDVSCDGSETSNGYHSCIHGGEKRKVVVTGYNSCANLALFEALDAFEWQCRVEAGVATYHTNGLKLTAGLGDLIQTNRTWKNNSVLIKYMGVPIATSTPSAWWSNNLVAPPAHTGEPKEISTVTNVEGDIIVINSDLTHSGFNIDMDRVGIVVLPGNTLSFGGGVGCVWATGENKDGGMEENCAFAAGSQKFLWVEGNVNGSTAFGNLDIGVLFSGVSFSRINRYHQRQGDDTGVGLVNSTRNKLTNVKVENWGDWSNIYFEGSSNNIAIDIQGAQANHGLHLVSASNNNTFVNVRMFNSKDNSNNINLNDSRNNTFVGVMSSSAGEASFRLQNNSIRNTVSHFTSTNDDDEVFCSGSDYLTLNQIVAANSAKTWASLQLDAGNALISQAVVSQSKAVGISVVGDNARFTHNILVGNSTGANCAISAAFPGLTSSCTNAGTSDANIISGGAINLASTFRGKVTTDDAQNTSDTLGVRSYSASLIDWLLFENPFRVWGRDGSNFPNLDNLGACGSGTCRIWDWRISATDTVIRNRSGNGSTENEPFIGGATCPSAVHGNKIITDQNSSPRTFLVNAVEIMGDGFGNENGLCENSEACLYSPHFGYYQGEGDYKFAGTCNFQNGTVSNVMMYGYPDL